MSSPHEENSVHSFTESENDMDETDSNDCNQNGQVSNPYIMQWLESKQQNQKFHYEGYVEYSKNADVVKCLIQSCHRLLSSPNAGSIKRHYRRLHNFVILHGKLNPFPDGEEDSLQLDKYFLHDPVSNKSTCKVPGCTVSLDGKDPNNMRHFRLGHNFKTNHHDWVNLCRLRYDRSKLRLNELVTYDKKTATYRCLFLNCDYILEKNFNAIEKHYYDLHTIIFSKYICKARSLYQIKNKEKDILQLQLAGNSSLNEQPANESKRKKQTKKKSKAKLIASNSIRKRFFSNNYVKYCKKANVSICLIQNCGRHLKGFLTSNIQRHYQKMHDMLSIRFYKNLSVDNYIKNEKLDHFVSYNVSSASYQCLFINCHENFKKDALTIQNHYYEKHEMILKKRKTKIYRTYTIKVENKPDFSKTFNKTYNSTSISLKPTVLEKFVLTNYVDLNDEKNISQCLIKNCLGSAEELKDEQNIKKHYQKKHNIHIGLNLPYDFGEQEGTNINDFAFYDQEHSTYKCLFITCNQTLENSLSYLKKHYQEKHTAIIGKCSQTSCRKRRNYHHESASSEDDPLSISNEFLSDEETPLQLQKRQRCISIESSDNDQNELCSLKKEYSNELAEAELDISPINFDIMGECGSTPVSPHPLGVKSTVLDITLTKHGFLKSCFGLIIQHDLSLNLFDDNVFFKHLISPYEKIINFHLNANILLDLMFKANVVIVDILKESFCHRIVCLELFVVCRENKHYLIINVRLISEKSIRNNPIGFLLINKAGNETISLFEYLNKFNIDKQQVYMTTISADFQDDDEETIEILNNICKHNSNIKTHPLHCIQLLYRQFVQNYSYEIRNWQTLSNNKDCKIDTNVFHNLSDLQKQMENLSEADSALKADSIKEPKLFLKTLQTFRNFMEKLHEEQYVAGDFYRDLLCCELELKGEHKKNNNTYAGELYKDLMECKNTLMQSNEFMAALYLDARFNFLVGARLLTDEQKMKGKVFLCTLSERFSKHLLNAKSQIDSLVSNEDCQNDLKVTDNDGENDDEYALLTQHINDIMPVNSNVIIEDLITNCVPAKREPFNLDILKYWHSKRQVVEDINELTKIVFTFSSSQYMLNYLKDNFSIYRNDNDKIDKFLIKHNQNILDNYLDLIYQD